jgi:uncharacterized protein RhaS with RHS repeats
LSYFGGRYYNAALGRLLNRDPIDELGGVNVYVYGGNDPIDRIDPLGQMWCDREQGCYLMSLYGPSRCPRPQSREGGGSPYPDRDGKNKGLPPAALWHRPHDVESPFGYYLWFWQCAACAAANSDNNKQPNEALKTWKRNATPAPTKCEEDATQHCLGAAMMAGKCGASCAELAGDAYERYQHVRHGAPISQRNENNNRRGARQCGDAADKVGCCARELAQRKLDTDLDAGEKECQ